MNGTVQPPARPLPPPPPPDWEPGPAPTRRKGGPGKVLAVLIVLLLLLSLLFLTPVGKMFFSGLAGKSYPSSCEFVLRRTVTIDVISGQIEYMCDIPVPLDISNSNGAIQDIVGMEESPQADSVEKYGTDWLVWSGPEDGTATLEIEYTVMVRTVVWGVNSDTSGDVNDIPQSLIDSLGGDEWEVEEPDGTPTGEYMIWPSSPEIDSLSGDLTSPGMSVFDNVRSVYDFMRDNFDYKALPGSEPKPCLQTLEEREGDCDDQSMLLVSLLRAAGIPSWLVFGFLYDPVREIWGAHAWAEVYMPLADGTGGSVAIDVVNGEFLVRNCNRLEEWKSDGNGEHMADYYHTLTYNYTVFGQNHGQPVVQLDDSCEGEYEASSERVYAMIGWHPEAMTSPFTSRKVL